mmetsp:Transcript_20384/g.41456  ORF Transcript_20384/g.41456 Transcript_20384/m.41456 type:complete len:281 (-) Transcript_20384:301-1143(-)
MGPSPMPPCSSSSCSSSGVLLLPPSVFSDECCFVNFIGSNVGSDSSNMLSYHSEKRWTAWNFSTARMQRPISKSIGKRHPTMRPALALSCAANVLRGRPEADIGRGQDHMSHETGNPSFSSASVTLPSSTALRKFRAMSSASLSDAAISYTTIDLSSSADTSTAVMLTLAISGTTAISASSNIFCCISSRRFSTCPPLVVTTPSATAPLTMVLSSARRCAANFHSGATLSLAIPAARGDNDIAKLNRRHNVCLEMRTWTCIVLCILLHISAGATLPVTCR